MSKLEKKNFFFSIIMATYNVEPYIDDAINSLVRQSLNFTKNVELIIVNDGSTDNSIEKAKYWQSKYPENIFIIDQKNTGVSEARNVGIAKAKGKYINFLDPDDKLDYNVLLSVKKFFLKNKEIKIVHIPLKFFEARKGPHRLNKYFEKDVEIIYIDDDYKKIFAHISSSFIAKSILTEDETLRFERNRKYGEDLELIAKLVERERVFALINGNFYNYRVRTLKNSSMDLSRKDPDAYIPNLMMLLNLIYIHLEEGKLDKWLQTLILYDICWKIKREILPFEASEEFYSEYTTLLFHCLNYIDVSIIEESEFLRPFQINTLLFLKENKRFPLYCDEFSQKKLKENNQKFKKGELKVISTKIYITKYRRESNSFNITGIIDELFDDKNLTIYATDGYKKFKGEFIYSNTYFKILNIPVYPSHIFNLNIPLDYFKRESKLELRLCIGNISQKLNLIFTGEMATIGNTVKLNYIWTPAYLIRYDFVKNEFNLEVNSIENLNKYECALRLRLLKINSITLSDKRRIMRLRNLSIESRVNGNIINIFQDREFIADDNAEHLYDYIQKKHPEWDNYFVLKKDNIEWDRLKSKGFRLVEFGSRMHEEIMVQADNFISSQANLSVLHPFKNNFAYIRDCYYYNFIFLQHGVTKHDLSDWLNKLNKDIRRLITVSKYEADAFETSNYCYTKNEIKITGFPRFDKYTSKMKAPKNSGTLLIAPTWREGIWNVSDSFYEKKRKMMESSYYSSWQEYIESDYLNNFYKEGNKILFLLHPLLSNMGECFTLPNYIKKVPKYTSYSKLLQEIDVLVTDFSSIYFDVAYQEKPVIYYQFDSGNRTNKPGYFNFYSMGFGKVVTNVKEASHELEIIKNNNYLLSWKYKKRVQNFFEYKDVRNCRRVTAVVEELVFESGQYSNNIGYLYTLRDLDLNFKKMDKVFHKHILINKIKKKLKSVIKKIRR